MKRREETRPSSGTTSSISPAASLKRAKAVQTTTVKHESSSSVAQQNQSKTTAQQEDDFIEVKRSGVRVWLVKIPNFVAERWALVTAPNIPLGSVRVHHHHTTDSRSSSVEGPKISQQPSYPKVTLHLPLDQEWCADLPKNYQLSFTHIPVVRGSSQSSHTSSSSSIASNKQSFVFSEAFFADKASGTPVTSKALEISGKIEYEATMQPVQDADYRAIMKQRTLAAATSTRITQRLGIAEQRRADQIKLRPGDNQSARSHGLTSFSASGVTGVSKRAAAAIDRKERLPRSELLDLLFVQFERYTYWSLKSLMESTNQPAAWVKEVVGEICVLNKRGPYVGTYQLKPEFKTVEKQQAASATAAANGEVRNAEGGGDSSNQADDMSVDA